MRKKRIEDPDFEKLLEQMGEEEKQMFEELNIHSMEDLFFNLVSRGIDPMKMMTPPTDADRDKGFDIKDFAIEEGSDLAEMQKMLNGNPGLHFANSDEEDWDDEDDEEDFYDDEEDDDEDWDPFELPSGLILDEPAREFHIRVKLNGAPVKIWRELKVPSNISLELLSHILIEAMGWMNEHLHQFTTKDGIIYKDTKDLKETRDLWGFIGRRQYRDANEYSLNSILAVKGERIKFEYDFGDSWTHDVWMKGVREYEPGEEQTVKLVKGSGACPPEDCGGVWGYAVLLAVRDKQRRPAEERDRLKWYHMDKHFDPEYFDVEEMEFYIEDFWESVLQEIEERKK